MTVIRDYRAILTYLGPDSSIYRINNPQPLGTAKVLTYRFADVQTSAELNKLSATGPKDHTAVGFDQDKAAALREMIGKIEAEAGIRFVEIPQNDKSADLTLSLVNDKTNPWAGLAYVAWGMEDSQSKPFVNLNLNKIVSGNSNLHLKRVGLHEILHTVGLKHPHEGGDLTLEKELDNKDQTIMSYSGTFGSDAKMGPLDAQAVEHLYGVKSFKELGVSADRYLDEAGKSYVRIIGTKGDDRIVSSTTNTEFWTGDGNDVIQGRQGDDRIYSCKGNDNISTGGGDDVIYASAGNDTIAAGGGDDQIFAGTGKNEIDAGYGDDVIHSAGMDKITTGSGNDKVVLSDKKTASVITDYHTLNDTITIYGKTVEIKMLQEHNLTKIYVKTDLTEHWLDAHTTSSAERVFKTISVVDPENDKAVSAEYELVNKDVFPAAPSHIERVEESDVLPGKLVPAPPLHDDTADHKDDDEEETPQDHNNASGGGCFVATAAYGTRNHPDVAFLRDFRDNRLVKTKAGRAFIRAYWVVGPKMAKRISHQSASGVVFRAIVGWVARRIREIS